MDLRGGGTGDRPSTVDEGMPEIGTRRSELAIADQIDVGTFLVRSQLVRSGIRDRLDDVSDDSITPSTHDSFGKDTDSEFRLTDSNLFHHISHLMPAHSDESKKRFETAYPQGH
jgi:hypothetical protein